MKNNENGFYIVSFLVYLFIFSLLVSVSFHMISIFLLPAIRSMKNYSQQMSLYIAGDNFINDIRTAQLNNSFTIKNISDAKVIFENEGYILKWRFKEGKLERLSKETNSKKNTLNVVCTNVNGQFSSDYSNNAIRGIEMTLFSQHNNAVMTQNYVAIQK